MRNNFKKGNKEENEKILWQWKKNSIVNLLYISSYDICLKKEINEIVSILGFPDSGVNSWRYSNNEEHLQDILNKALKLDLIEIVWDSEDGLYVDIDEYKRINVMLFSLIKKHMSLDELIEWINNHNLEDLADSPKEFKKLMEEMNKINSIFIENKYKESIKAMGIEHKN